MTAQCSDENHLPAHSRHDTPKSGSRREAVGVLIEAARDAQNTWSAYSDKVNKIQAAVNYMIVHDGW